MSEGVVLNPTRLVLAALIGLVILLVLIIKFNVQAMIAILIGAISIGLLAGMPTKDIIAAVNDGIGNTLKGIALLVGLGSLSRQWPYDSLCPACRLRIHVRRDPGGLGRRTDDRRHDGKEIR